MEQNKKGKVLVCITAQSNSKRLIDHGSELAGEVSGDLHILHVEKGNNIFANENTPNLMQELFMYGSQRGGMVHALSGEDVLQTIEKFIRNYRITHMVVGENTQKENGSIFSEGRLPNVEIVTVKRYEMME